MTTSATIRYVFDTFLTLMSWKVDFVRVGVCGIHPGEITDETQGALCASGATRSALGANHRWRHKVDFVRPGVREVHFEGERGRGQGRLRASGRAQSAL